MRLWALYLDWPVNVQRLQVYQAKQRNTYFQICRADRLVKWSSTKLKQNHVLKINHDIFVNNIIRGTRTCILLSFLILSESPQHATKNKAKLACCGRKPIASPLGKSARRPGPPDFRRGHWGLSEQNGRPARMQPEISPTHAGYNQH